jgi:hypothetical protein
MKSIVLVSALTLFLTSSQPVGVGNGTLSLGGKANTVTHFPVFVPRGIATDIINNTQGYSIKVNGKTLPTFWQDIIFDNNEYVGLSAYAQVDNINAGLHAYEVVNERNRLMPTLNVPLANTILRGKLILNVNGQDFTLPLLSDKFIFAPVIKLQTTTTLIHGLQAKLFITYIISQEVAHANVRMVMIHPQLD